MVCALILVVEDEDDVAHLMVRALSREGYAVERVDNGTEALRRLLEQPPAAVLLDLGLPDVDGLEVCRRARSGGYDGGIVVVTARTDSNVELSHAAGADDHVAKPFGLAELQARVREVLRVPGRSGRPALATTTSGLGIDLAMRRATAGSVELALTDREFDVLALLAATPGQVVPSSSLLAQGWGAIPENADKLLDMTVRQLGRKLAASGTADTISVDAGGGFVLHVGPSWRRT